ncbi:MAG TPA: hypothetical protein VNZ26_28290 [Vicinamibacterales bacterium]|jgi:hypothetical protein|nr:hypothetical protein [Vicinamibacterales bacterium]
MAHLPEAVRTLERELRGIFHERLKSLTVYGQSSHGSGRAGKGEHDSHGAHDHDATTHTMAIVDTLGHDDLRACGKRLRAWHDEGLATPLLMAAHEFETALDVFPLEFGAILDDHVVVFGTSPFDGLKVDPADVRRACEGQARSHLLHLRGGYLETHGRSDALAVLIVRSAPPLAALLKSVARLEGVGATDAAAAGRHAERTLGLAGGALGDIVNLVGIREISSEQAERLFPPYLDAMERLVKYVDGWRMA